MQNVMAQAGIHVDLGLRRDDEQRLRMHLSLSSFADRMTALKVRARSTRLGTEMFPVKPRCRVSVRAGTDVRAYAQKFWLRC
jgi:hypothetical protein